VWGELVQRFYQFTAIDEAARFRVLRIYDHNNAKTAIDFLREVHERFLLVIRKIQTDNDSSFGPSSPGIFRISAFRTATSLPEALR
jgi:hypothetical protein